MTYDFRAGRRFTARMEQEELIKIFDSLRPKQHVMIVMRAVMSMSPSETGTPTEYIVGRRTSSRGGRVQSISLLPADGRKIHPMAKKTLYKMDDYEGNPAVSVAIGNMGASLISLEPV